VTKFPDMSKPGICQNPDGQPSPSDLLPRGKYYGLRSPSVSNKLARAAWNIVYFGAFRFSPTPAHAWRRLLLRMFGARVGARVVIYPSVQIWAPWQLSLDKGSTIGPGVELYNVASIHIGEGAIVSQYAYLCTASHDYKIEFQLIAAPIAIKRQAWLAAACFVGPGVSIGEGAVVAARATVTRSVPSWTVVGGNPAGIIGRRPSTARNILHSA
jgi:putative colanic acid biosynthesis acetyltransferase WcaF